MAPIHLGLNEVLTEVDPKGHGQSLRGTVTLSQARPACWDYKSNVLPIALPLPSSSVFFFRISDHNHQLDYSVTFWRGCVRLKKKN